MGDTTEISWAHSTFNPWIGCSKVSPGCENCYAERYGARFGVGWGPGEARRRTSAENWKKPLAWNKAAALRNAALLGRSEPHRVFCASLADWLDPDVPTRWLADLLAVIQATPNLTWMLLSKRPQLWRARLERIDLLELAAAAEGLGLNRFTLPMHWLAGEPPANVWLGTTVEDQRRADERIPHLRAIPARTRFLSCEPLLGRVRLDQLEGIHWIITGGESGPGARPMHPEWARSLLVQARRARVAFHHKQNGEFVGCPVYPERPNDVDEDGLELDPCRWLDEHSGFEERVLGLDGAEHDVDLEGQPPPGCWYMARVGRERAGRKLAGRLWDEFPGG